ncbi:MmpS family transport accessory protein [Mycobacterium sp. NPDC050041]|uniref:MmpS family transport accessory protein n=1 Tax=Mycobacterium sp. NPDC050041 TaxID=3364293 RepID=UPI003C2C38D8
MTGSRRDGEEPGYHDPAYANQPPYGNYPPPTGPAPTQRLPQYPAYGYDPSDPYAAGQYGGHEPAEAPPGGPKSPQWLWWVAAAAVLVVVGLVIALVISNSSRQQTVVAPAPAMPEPTASSTPRTTTPRTTTATSPSPTPVLPLPTSSAPTPTTTASGQTETVTYDVSGEGRAISITYTDSGGLPQTEFNVALPWSKQVDLPAPAQSAARISIINLGNQVSCTVSINGATTEERTGAGLTICAGLG